MQYGILNTTVKLFTISMQRGFRGIYLIYLIVVGVMQIQNEIKCKIIFNYSNTMNMTNNYVN